MAPFAKNAGSASALMGAIQLGLGALASFAVGVFVKNSVAPMVLIITVTTLIALVVLNIGKRFIKEKVSIDDSENGISIGH
jgi:DHA1 family bicyclomycin/chloramphenicol resistance-like MFS transporter